MAKLVPKGNELHIGLFAWRPCFLTGNWYGLVNEYYAQNEYVKNLGKVADCFTFSLWILSMKWVSLF